MLSTHDRHPWKTLSCVALGGGTAMNRKYLPSGGLRGQPLEGVLLHALQSRSLLIRPALEVYRANQGTAKQSHFIGVAATTLVEVRDPSLDP